MQEQLAMIRSLVESSRPAPSEPRVGEGRSTVQDKLVLSKFNEGEDVEAYLTTFERLMTVYGIDEERWAIKLASQLSGRAQQAYAALSADVAGDYKRVKKAILRRCDISEETYRQRFRATRRKENEAYSELATRLQDLAGKWLADCDSVQTIMDKLVMEQMLDVMPANLRIWLCERKPTSVAETGSMADDYLSARTRKQPAQPKPDIEKKEVPGKETRRCHLCQQVGHIAANCRERQRSETDARKDRSRDQTERKCYNCHQRGHIARQCPNALYCGGVVGVGHEVAGRSVGRGSVVVDSERCE